jgi:hypothetical protein
MLVMTNWLGVTDIAINRAAKIAMPGMLASSSLKECSRPPKSRICQFTSAVSISASSASRSDFGATGSLEPWITNTAALMSPFFAQYHAGAAHQTYRMLDDFIQDAFANRL